MKNALKIISYRSMFSTSMTDAGTASLHRSISDEVETTPVSKSELPTEEPGKCTCTCKI